MKEYMIINNRTNETMERTYSMAEAIEIKSQYDEMGAEEVDSEYRGTYRIEAA